MEQFKKANLSDIDTARQILLCQFQKNSSSAARSFATYCKNLIQQHCDKSLVSNEQFYLFLFPDANRNCQVCNIKLTKFRGHARGGWGKYCSIQCSSNSPDRKQLFKETSLAKYGHVSPNKNELIQKKRQQTNLAKYGHISNLHSIEARQQIRDKMKQSLDSALAKCKTTNLERYGTEWQTQRNSFIESSKKRHSELAADRDVLRINQITQFMLLEHRENRQHLWKHIECGHEFSSLSLSINCPNCFKKSSSIEMEINDFISLEYSGTVERHARIFCDRREVDFYLPEFNFAIEVNGIYWHRDEVDEGRMLSKSNYCRDNNVHLIHVWETDWLFNQDLVKSFIRSKLRKCKSIFARQLNIVELSAADAKKFLTENHRQGYANSSIKLGLVDANEEVAAVLTLGKPRYDKSVQWEIIRYSAKANINVVGGLSKLLAYFIRTQKPQSIGTYVDHAWGYGKSYEKIGFKFKKLTSPGYFWVNSRCEIVTRYEAQLKNLHRVLGNKFNTALSEQDNMSNNGFWKCKNVGNLYFVMLPDQK